MNCPVCHTELKPFTYHGVTIHECATCKGKWFEGDELVKAINKKDDDLRWIDFTLFEEKKNKYTDSIGKRSCPKDTTKMNTLEYMDSKVTIDKCEICGGVWLDGNEFDKIVTYLEKLLVRETASDYAKEAFKKFIDIGTGQENTLSEIKDFLVVTKLYEMKLAAEHPWIHTAMQKIYQYIPFN